MTAMVSERSRVLHNFTFPSDLTWGVRRRLRCIKADKINGCGGQTPRGSAMAPKQPSTGLFVGINKGHIVTKKELAPRPSDCKGEEKKEFGAEEVRFVLLDSPSVQEKLYMKEKCLVASDMLQKIASANSGDGVELDASSLKGINSLIKQENLDHQT